MQVQDCPTHHQSYMTKQNNTPEIGRTCTEGKNNLQSIKHRAQIMEAKYFCVLAYKHETDYNESVSQTKIYGHQWSHLQKSRSTWSSRGGLAVNLSSCTGIFTSSCQPLQNCYLLVYIGRKTDHSLP